MPRLTWWNAQATTSKHSAGIKRQASQQPSDLGGAEVAGGEHSVCWVWASAVGIPAARRAGVRRVLLTHPSYTVPAMSPTAAAELTTQGAYAEVTAYNCFTNPTATQPASRSSSVRSATTAPSCPPTPGNPTAPTHRRLCSSSSTHSPARDSTPTHSLRAPRKSPNASSHPDPAGQMIANIRIRVDPDDLGHQLTSTPGTRPDSAS